MSATVIGRVKSSKSFKSYEVKWSPSDRNVYVSYAGWTKIGEASSASQAMQLAEAYVYNK
jgi:hypothetical protein